MGWCEWSKVTYSVAIKVLVKLLIKVCPKLEYPVWPINTKTNSDVLSHMLIRLCHTFKPLFIGRYSLNVVF